MRRSEINRQIKNTKSFFKKMNFNLPEWAFWDVREWSNKDGEVREIIECGLGWDITDFGSGDFRKIGLINFNLRNGIVNKTRKTYCEKIIVVQENQVTPLHTHKLKIEDIINRAGGNLVLELNNSNNEFIMNAQNVTVMIDGIPRTVPKGGKVILKPGESICLEPGIFHLFYGEAGKGLVLVGEVSSVNDDNTDNLFIDGNLRFPSIEEDEEPLHLLVNDYRRFVKIHA